MKRIFLGVVMVLQVLLFLLLLRAEYGLQSWASLSSSEISSSPDASYFIAHLRWQSGFFLGCCFGICLPIIISRAFAQMRSQDEAEPKLVLVARLALLIAVAAFSVSWWFRVLGSQ